MRRSKFLALSLIVAVTLFMVGCATILTGTKDTITIETEPPGAEIIIDGISYGKTPATITLTRPGLSDKMVTLKLEGYKPIRFILQKEFNTVAILNLTDALGWAIDIVSGAVYKYSPKYYKFTLEKEKQAYRLADLEKDERGRYLVPGDSDEVFVRDEAHKVVLVFSKK